MILPTFGFRRTFLLSKRYIFSREAFAVTINPFTMEFIFMMVFVAVVNEIIQPNSYNKKCQNLQKPASACCMAFC